MKKHLITLLTTGILLGAVATQAELIVTYDLGYPSLTGSASAANITTVNDLQLISLTKKTEAGNAFGGLEFEGMDGTTSMAFSAASGFEIVIDQITFKTNNISNNNTTMTLSVNAVQVGSGNVTAQQTYDSGAISTAAASSVTVDIFWNGTATWPDQELRDVQIFGTVTAVPEPSTYALALGFLALGGVMLRRRFKA